MAACVSAMVVSITSNFAACFALPCCFGCPPASGCFGLSRRWRRLLMSLSLPLVCHAALDSSLSSSSRHITPATAVACSFVCHPAGIRFCCCLFSFVRPINFVILSAAKNPRICFCCCRCFCRCLFFSSLLITDSQVACIHAPIPHPPTIFHAFTQQNRMSSPQTRQKNHNPSPINKIKLSPK